MTHTQRTRRTATDRLPARRNNNSHVRAESLRPNCLKQAIMLALFPLAGAAIVAAPLVLPAGQAKAAHHVATDTDYTTGTTTSYDDELWIEGDGTVVNIRNAGTVVQTDPGIDLVIGKVSDVAPVSDVVVNVTDSGQLTAGNKLFVGREGGLGELNIESGGLVTAQAGGNIGGIGAGSVGVINVRDTGTLDSVAGDFYVGGATTGTLNVFAGGRVTSGAGTWTVGYDTTGIGTVNVQGANGVMTLTGGNAHLAVGRNGSGTLNVTDGGRVLVGGYVRIGELNGTGVVNVDGNGTVFQTTGSGSFYVGTANNGNTGKGTLTISNGGVVHVSGGEARIGYGGGEGAINIGAGALAPAAEPGSLSVTKITMGDLGQMVYNHTAPNYAVLSEFVSKTTGAGRILQLNPGSTTILAADNDSFSGAVDIQGGTLQIGLGGDAGTIGSADASIGAGARLVVDRTGSSTISGVLSGDGSFEHVGSGTTFVTGLNSYGGGTRVSAGTLSGNTDSLQGDIVNEAALVFDQATADGVYSGSLSGNGTLYKDGAFALTLAENASAGAVNHNAGTLNIGAGKTLGVDNAVNVGSGATVGVDVSSNPAITANSIDFAGGNTLNITGYSPRTDTGVYTLATTTSGITGDFVTTVAGQALSTYVDLDIFLVGSARIVGNDILAKVGLVWNNIEADSAHGTFNIGAGQRFELGDALANNTTPGALGFGWSGEDLTKTGDGILVLDAVNVYAGYTDVQAGMLVLGSSVADSNAQVAGDLEVRNGATLAGHGKVLGTATVHSGGTLSPGTSIGTLTVGDAHFMDGSVFEVEVNPDGSNDKLIASSALGGTGTVTLDTGSILSLLAGAGTWGTEIDYTLIDTDGGVTGEFSDVTSNLAFLTATVDYTNPDQVRLTMRRNETGFDDLDGTYNQNNTGNGVESLGPGDSLYDQVVSMDSEQAKSAFDRVSGEIHGSVKSAALLNSRYARDAVRLHLDSQPNPGAPRFDLGQRFWMNSWYHDGYLKRDGNASRLDNEGWGLLVGTDLYQGERSTLGVAAGYERNRLKTDRLRDSRADMDAVHLFVYGQTQLGSVDLKGGVGYSWLDIDSKRTVEVGELYNRNRAVYDGSLAQAFVEASHRFQVNDAFAMTPYVNLIAQRVRTDRFNEGGYFAAGSPTALQHSGDGNSLVTSTLGFRGEWNIGDRGSVAYADLGWQHNYGHVAPKTSLNFLGGSRYTIRGVEMDDDTGVVNLGARFQLRPDMRLGLGYEGMFGSHTLDHVAKAQLELDF